jgi:hypothetical protein
MKNYTERLLKAVFAKAPIEAIEAYESANAARRGRTSSVAAEPRIVTASEPTRPTPEAAQAVIDKARKNLSDVFLAAMKAVRGIN